MELQKAEGKIMLTFIRSKCFVKFFVYVLFSLTLLLRLVYCFSFF